MSTSVKHLQPLRSATVARHSRRIVHLHPVHHAIARPADVARARRAGRSPASFPSRAASSRRCTAAGCGRCGSTPGSARAAESNARYRYLLAQGVSGLSVAFDLPTQMGYDSDHPLAAGEVGRVGVRHRFDRGHGGAVRRHSARSRLDVDDDQRDGDRSCSRCTSPSPSGRASPLAELSGTIQNDILKEYVARGTYIYPAARIAAASSPTSSPSATRAAELEHDFDQRLPHPRSGIDGGAGGRLHVRERDRVRPGGDRRGPRRRSRSAQRLSFFFNAHNDFLEEIAKFRAARRLWARIMRDRFGATDPRAQQLRFHTQTAGSTLTAQQPDNNIVRVALQALAAVLGGTQSLHCNGRDEALALPTEESARIALRTQQIIAAESGVANTVDPVGGSWTIEKRTTRSNAEAEALIARIDAAGGTLRGDRDGLHPAADSGRGLRGAAGDRARRDGCGRRQRFADDAAARDERVLAPRPGRRTPATGRGASGASRRDPPHGTLALDRSSTAREDDRISCRRSCRPSKHAPRWARFPTPAAACSASTRIMARDRAPCFVSSLSRVQLRP